MKKILVIHGPNLNLLGKREPDVYGNVTIEEINAALKTRAKELKLSLEAVQSNHEGEIVDLIGKADKKYSAIIINPAAYTHTSVAIRDALQAIRTPAVEVHLSNIYAREEFRRQSLTAPACRGQISGFGKDSYVLALEAVLALLDD
jgi:3-dehydroquinate dehydratase-2